MTAPEPLMTAISFKGEVVHGVIRGRELVERFSDRLVGMIGWRPYHGTLNVRLEEPLNIRFFETKRLEHVMLDGSVWVDASLAPAKLRFKDRVIECWWIREERGLHEDDVVEIIAKDRLMDAGGMNYGDTVEVELYRRPLTYGARLRILWYSLFPKGRVVK